jgi:dUTP pyrophosphatase
MWNWLVDKFYNLIDSGTQFKVQLLYSGAKTPIKADSGCAGYDVFSTMGFIIKPGTRQLVPLGIKIEISRQFYLRVAPRSGLSVRGIDIGAGVIDSSYRGEVKVLVINNSNEDFKVESGTKIAQLILERCSNTLIKTEDILSRTERGFGGFGSTGQ